MDFTQCPPKQLRDVLAQLALEWERRYAVAPTITSAISEYDAARLVGHTAASYGTACVHQTAVTRGVDFVCDGVRYQVKANRPSGKAGSRVTLVAKAKNYEWDRLIWILYDREYRPQEAWEWQVDDYREQLGDLSRSPDHLRKGRPLLQANQWASKELSLQPLPKVQRSPAD